ncbi:MAG TPA: hypothetical protein VNT53_10245 [Pseudolysinimonas sp.]|nr:hypothetical protein [Pseudolysinimonas sp.]
MLSKVTALSAGAVLLILLTGCVPVRPISSPSPSATETPSATPTVSPSAPPAADDLALSPDGLGTLVFGEPPVSDPATRMVIHDETACTDARTGNDFGISAGDPGADLWVPIPLYQVASTGRAPWGVHVDSALRRIDLYDGHIPTTEGIRIGDTGSAARSAYPGADVVHAGLTDILAVTGAHGTLQIEIARQPTGEVYWEPADLDKVVFIHATDTPEVFSVAASENIVGVCNS